MATTINLGTFSKQSTETLDYNVDFTDWFSNRTDTADSHTAVAEAGITVVSSSLASNVVKVVLSGGTVNVRYKITVRLTTSSGVIKEVDFFVSIRDI